MTDVPDPEKGEPREDDPVFKTLSVLVRGGKNVFDVNIQEGPKPSKQENPPNFAQRLQKGAEILENQFKPLKNQKKNPEEGAVSDTEAQHKTLMEVKENVSSPVEDNSAKAESSLNSEAGQLGGSDRLIAELYLIERPDDEEAELNIPKEVLDLFSDKPKNYLKTFLLRHSKDSISQIGTYAYDMIAGATDRQADEHTFFAKWSRHVRQTKEKWKIEKSIRAEKPYDVEIFGGPKQKRISHNSYARFPKHCRNYYLLSESPKEEELVDHALNECVSLFSPKIGDVYKCNEMSLPFSTKFIR
jgi:hypothetical protein